MNSSPVHNNDSRVPKDVVDDNAKLSRRRFVGDVHVCSSSLDSSYDISPSIQSTGASYSRDEGEARTNSLRQKQGKPVSELWWWNRLFRWKKEDVPKTLRESQNVLEMSDFNAGIAEKNAFCIKQALEEWRLLYHKPNECSIQIQECRSEDQVAEEDDIDSFHDALEHFAIASSACPLEVCNDEELKETAQAALQESDMQVCEAEDTAQQMRDALHWLDTIQETIMGSSCDESQTSSENEKEVNLRFEEEAMNMKEERVEEPGPVVPNQTDAGFVMQPNGDGMTSDVIGNPNDERDPHTPNFGFFGTEHVGYLKCALDYYEDQNISSVPTLKMSENSRDSFVPSHLTPNSDAFNEMFHEEPWEDTKLMEAHLLAQEQTSAVHVLCYKTECMAEQVQQLLEQEQDDLPALEQSIAVEEKHMAPPLLRRQIRASFDKVETKRQSAQVWMVVFLIPFLGLGVVLSLRNLLDTQIHLQKAMGRRFPREINSNPPVCLRVSRHQNKTFCQRTSSPRNRCGSVKCHKR